MTIQHRIRSFKKASAGGGGVGGVTGNLRWGPNMGTTPSVVGAAISAAEYRQGLNLNLTAQEAISLKGTITALLPLASVQTLQIFYTLVFLYQTFVQAAITMPALQLNGALAAQGVITGNLVAAYGAEQVAAAMRLVSLVLTGQLSLQAVLTGLYQIAYPTVLGVQGAIRQPALQLVGALRAQAAMTQPALKLLGLTSVSGTVLGLYAITYPTALGIVGTLGMTYVMNWQSAGTFNLSAPLTANYKCESWAGGGGGGGGIVFNGGGGAGGSFSRTNSVAFTAAGNIKVVVAATAAGGGASASGTVGNDSWISTTTVAPTTTAQGCLAKGGALGAVAGPAANGAAGVGSTTGDIGDTKFAGGTGSPSTSGGGGGGDANAGSGSTGGAVGGGNGGTGNPAVAGSAAGGGGGGGGAAAAGAAGAIGICRVTVVAI